MTDTSQARARLALAADLPLDEGLRLYQQVAPHVAYAKVGLSLFVEHGPAAVAAFQKLGARVFLDLRVRTRGRWRRDEGLLDRLGIE